MLDALGMISALRRPALLIAAARHGVRAYDRARHLPKLPDAGPRSRPAVLILRLLDAESAHESRRAARDPAYSPRRHVEVLVALLGEARELRSAGLRVVAG